MKFSPLFALRDTASNYIRNMSGWTTNRNLVVFESDDWGSVRMHSKSAYNQLLKKGFRVDEIAYERFDSLASETDLCSLFETLNRYRDHKNKPPIFTANTIVANPDFRKIKDNGFSSYVYELFTETLKRYPEHSKAFNIWKNGKNEGLFYPQFHGREHVNTALFMEDLKENVPDLHTFFEYGMAGYVPGKGSAGGNRYVEHLNFRDDNEKKQVVESLGDGLARFEEIFGYQSKTMAPPNYYWHRAFETVTAECGVRYLQGRKKMKQAGGNGQLRLLKKRLGETNRAGQLHLVRNVFFEPTLYRKDNTDPVDKALKAISAAFLMNKPAIICTHRLNYIGYIDPDNRDRNLKLLHSLLARMLKKWPDIEFVTSQELGEIMEGGGP
jgi:hypothetical protein